MGSSIWFKIKLIVSGAVCLFLFIAFLVSNFSFAESFFYSAVVFVAMMFFTSQTFINRIREADQRDQERVTRVRAGRDFAIGFNQERGPSNLQSAIRHNMGGKTFSQKISESHNRFLDQRKENKGGRFGPFS